MFKIYLDDIELVHSAKNKKWTALKIVNDTAAGVSLFITFAALAIIVSIGLISKVEDIILPMAVYQIIIGIGLFLVVGVFYYMNSIFLKELLKAAQD